MSWAGHGAGAVKIGGGADRRRLRGMVHAVVPGWFTETAGKTVDPHLRPYPARKAGAPDPENWPDYEI